MEFVPPEEVRALTSFRELVSWAIGAYAPEAGQGSMEEVELRVGAQSYHVWTDGGRERTLDYGDCPGHQHAYWFLRMGLFQSYDIDWITEQKTDPRFKEGPKARNFFDQETVYKLDELAFGARIPASVTAWITTRARDPRLKKKAVNKQIPFRADSVRAAINATKANRTGTESPGREGVSGPLGGLTGANVAVLPTLPGPAGVMALSNIPAPWYGDFIDRPPLRSQLIECLESTQPVVCLVGVSGRGKTTLAHRVALEQVGKGQLFRAVVWVSDEEIPGTTTLDSLFEAISVTLNDPTLARGDVDVGSERTLALLAQVPTLLVLNNFETITDPDVGHWIRLVPSPSKVMLTSTIAPRGMGHFMVEVDVERPDDSVAPAFFERLLRQRALSGITAGSPELMTLWEAADGNFKLLERAVGLLRRRPVEVILKDIRNSADPDLDLLRESWSALSDDGQLLLRALSLFPDGAEHTSVIAVTGMPEARFERAMTELQDARFASPQLRAFSLSYSLDGLAARRARAAVEQGADEDLVGRWMGEALRIANTVGFCPDDVSRLRALDAPGVRSAVEYAIIEADRRGLDEIVIELCREVRYYYYVRGLWSATPNVNLMRAEAARRLADAVEEFDALVYHINIAAKQHNVAEVERRLPRLQELVTSAATELSPRALAELRHARALYHHARSECDASEQLWLENLRSPETLGPADYSANLRWFARCIVQRHDGRASAARKELKKAAEHAQAHGFRRANVVIQLQLADLDLAETSSRAPATVFQELVGVRQNCEELRDQYYLAEVEWLMARALRAMDRTMEATDQAQSASARFESLGLSDRAEETAEWIQQSPE
ncbi:hypothetical protein ACQEVI_25155 [Promicromonospora sp. CA-289599]|uniref:hypothetical protein n=1 Tax=Promicromonospora sp. CA-289599 TaxID=3240014 RepID=UPI003D90DFD0